MPSYDECLVDAELKARAAYSEPHRRHHDQQHLEDCLAELEAVHGLDEQERRLLKWAILWHDAVYEPERSDNEELSAELARRELIGCGVPQEDAEEVARLVRLTKGHSAEQHDRLGSLMVSIDLSILAADPERYRCYAEAIRREYEHLSDEEWSAGRSAVLEHLLNAEPLYPAPEFRDRFEQLARTNMEAELRTLRGG